MTYRCSDCGRHTARTPTERCWECQGQRNLTVSQLAYLMAVAELRIVSFPHTDRRVLHARGDCRYCSIATFDRLHDLRSRFDLAHTGALVEAGQDPCPSEAFRPVAVTELWPGNRARLDSPS